MKEELVNKVTALHEAVRDLNGLWSRLDWSVVPEVIAERYPFHADLDQVTNNVNEWLELIKRS